MVSWVKSGVVDDERCISCQKLYSIMKERCSTYLVLDARPRADYQDSHMTLANVINVPEEILKPGLTAGKISSELSEADQTLWVLQRQNAEFLVLVDWRSEHLPLPPPLQVLSDAMLKVRWCWWCWW
ncbi:Ubiquitin carboxyl-terminal hydrolase 8 [Portunus trituberculatus]|uniref:Ubiquitin carboxyl-terminal hydrolase 8 n=1 Tax=Portunus trituberculatus TaxID=210409 RepID=A0A5B7HRV2_PORTR|nr:Ubiquitin carboxyl-terminal hydrolase 8 [Portunus trituberculatus]